jgi:DNA-binding beta-propeller fold protein YncE
MVRGRRLSVECLEPRRLLASGTGEIHGTAWSDLNANGVWNDGEPGQAGVTVYLDTNGNGQLDVDQAQQPVEPITVTASDNPATSGLDETGTYQFTGLDAGEYTVAEVAPEEHEITYPLGTKPLTFVEAIVDGEDGVDGLDGALSVTVSPDGEYVYAAGYKDAALAVFHRDLASGELAFAQTVQTAGLGGVTSIAASPDGNHVYVAAFDDSALSVFDRNTGSGELALVQQLEDGQGGVDSLDHSRSVAVSPDGSHVYVAAVNDDAVSVFGRDTATGELALV